MYINLSMLSLKISSGALRYWKDKENRNIDTYNINSMIIFVATIVFFIAFVFVRNWPTCAC